MQPYRDIDGDSGVAAFESGPGFIRIQFEDGGLYLYTEASAGPVHIAQMKVLASRGDGLNAYITRHVRKAYERKER
jgi:hypothetical protein